LKLIIHPYSTDTLDGYNANSELLPGQRCELIDCEDGKWCDTGEAGDTWDGVCIRGPAGAVGDNIAVFNSTSGKLVKDGGYTVAAVKNFIPLVIDTGGGAAHSLSSDIGIVVCTHNGGTGIVHVALPDAEGTGRTIMFRNLGVYGTTPLMHLIPASGDEIDQDGADVELVLTMSKEGILVDYAAGHWIIIGANLV
jgi:hypothetical protein